MSCYGYNSLSEFPHDDVYLANGELERACLLFSPAVRYVNLKIWI